LPDACVAVWSYGGQATASGMAAAWWLGLTRFAPDIVEVTVPRNSHGRCHDGCVVRRRDLKSADIVEVRGLRITELALTVIEASVRPRRNVKLMDAALQRRVDLTALWRAHLRNKGRYGSPAARLLLQAAADGARSHAERLLIDILKAARITGWVANYPVAGYHVDVGFPKQKVALEVDGLAFHTDSEDFHHDRIRQNAIALAGWQVLRFTWLDLTEYPDRVIAEIRSAISAR
jgi:very-short-patch-repair endonuclease